MWIAIGLPFKNYALITIGLVFFALGIVNRKKWKKNRRTWKNMDKDERRLIMIVMIILAILVILGLIFFLLAI